MSNENHENGDGPPPGTGGLWGRLVRREPTETILENVAPVEAAPSGGGVYVHAWRRHWVVATLVGGLCALALGGAAWSFGHSRYTAVALLRVASKEQQLVFRTMDQDIRSDFETYRSTQQQLVTSRFVLAAALRNPEIAELPLVRQQRDPVAWLGQTLQVVATGRSEILPVQLTGEDPVAVAALVNAVVQAYLNEVVDVERNQRRQRLNELDRVYTDMEGGMRRRRNDLKQLAEQVGTGDPAALNLKQQIALQQYADLQAEWTKVQFARMRAELELQGKREQLDAPETIEVSASEVDSLAQVDPLILRILAEAEVARTRLAYDEGVVARRVGREYVQNRRRDLARLQRQVEARREVLQRELQEKKRAVVEEERKRLLTNVGILQAQEKRLAEATAEAKAQAVAVGGSSVDVELMRGELRQSEEVLGRVAEERERLQVELRNESRITLLQKAEVPPSPDRSSQLGLIGGACLLGWFGPVLGILWWDVRTRRVNGPADIHRQLGLPVLGTLPVLPPQAISEEGRQSPRQRHWHQRLARAIDGLVAALLRKTDQRRQRVLLVSSAIHGEGKTTLASQLALSLARTGHRTILVDFDLRRPALHNLFQVTLTPGVSELLQQETTLERVIRPLGDDLAFLPAGAANQEVIWRLARGAPGLLLDQLRQEYEFVIVDGSPVLPLADVRFVGRSVDAVVLAVLRDVSRLPYVQSAWELFEVLGVERLGVVVTGETAAVSYAYDETEEAAETEEAEVLA